MFNLDDPNIHKAGLMIVGNEILTGRTQDTNTMWIAEKMLTCGVLVAEVRIIPDVEHKIIEAVTDMSNEYDYVFTTGGIGPTHDDITAESVAKAFGRKLEHNEEAFRALEEYYGLQELTPGRASMSLIPEGAALIPNPVSAAPGFIVENVYVMAGVPRIMHAMLDHVISLIDKGTAILSNTVSCTLPESELSEALGFLQERYNSIEIGSYPHFRGGNLGLNLVLRGTDRDSLKKATEELMIIIKEHGDEPNALGLQVKIDEYSEAG